MKRTAVLFLLLLVVFAVCAASGEDARTPGLFDLYCMNGEDNPEWIGTAAAFYEGILIVPVSILPEDLSSLWISDGQNIWQADTVAPDNAGIAAVVVFDTEDISPSIGAYALTAVNTQATPTGCYVQTEDENRFQTIRLVYSVTPITWRGTPCLLASLSGPALPGSPLLTVDSGRLAGIAVAEWSEGTDRVVFMSPEGMQKSLSEALNAITGPEGSGTPEGFTVMVEANTVTFDWSAMQLPETKEGEDLYLVVADKMNQYLTYFRIEKDTECTMVLTPGRTYQSGILASAEAPDMLPDAYAETELPAAERLTDYGFTSVVCAIAEEPENGLPASGLPDPVTEVTEELLRSGRAYFYSSTTYEVTETIDDITLLITLTDPKGNNYRYLTGWMYDPSCMKNDTWAIPLSETNLLDFLNQNEKYPAGAYEVAFYIGGKLADSFSFDLE